jgi:hypothetical protein
MQITKTPPFKCIVDMQGYYTPEYIQWAIQRDNFAGSDLAHIMNAGDRSDHKFRNVVYAYGYTVIEDEARRLAARIRELGGLARVTKGRSTKKTPEYTVWFNPNGSNEAYEWVRDW